MIIEIIIIINSSNENSNNYNDSNTTTWRRQGLGFRVCIMIIIIVSTLLLLRLVLFRLSTSAPARRSRARGAPWSRRSARRGWESCRRPWRAHASGLKCTCLNTYMIPKHNTCFIVQRISFIISRRPCRCSRAPSCRSRHCARLGCGQMGSTLMGSQQQYDCLTDLVKPPVNKNTRIAVTPLVLTSFVRCWTPLESFVSTRRGAWFVEYSKTAEHRL